MTTVRLAFGGPPKAVRMGLSGEPAPALLASYAYLPQWQSQRDPLVFRDWAMDSGAFSVAGRGEVIDLQQYTDTCLGLLASDPQLSEVYALDVIGDWRGSARNTEEMWRQGVPAIPCYHFGEPEDVLLGYAKDYPKIALGGHVGIGDTVRREWMAQCFARVWPKAIHGFGVTTRSILNAFPFHSVDSSSWEQGPCAFGNWKAYGGQRPNLRGGSVNLRPEVLWYLRLEDQLKHRWRRALAQLEGV